MGVLLWKGNHHHHHHHHVARSVADIGDHGLPILSVVSSLDELIFRRFFLVMKLLRLSVYLVRCLPLLLVPQIFPLNICFSSSSALFISPKIIVVIFWWFWVGIVCIGPFPVLLGLTSFQSMIFSLFFWCTIFLLQVFFLVLLSVSSIHIHVEGWTICRLSECWHWYK